MPAPVLVAIADGSEKRDSIITDVLLRGDRLRIRADTG